MTQERNKLKKQRVIQGLAGIFGCVYFSPLLQRDSGFDGFPLHCSGGTGAPDYTVPALV